MHVQPVKPLAHPAKRGTAAAREDALPMTPSVEREMDFFGAGQCRGVSISQRAVERVVTFRQSRNGVRVCIGPTDGALVCRFVPNAPEVLDLMDAMFGGPLRTGLKLSG